MKNFEANEITKIITKVLEEHLYYHCGCLGKMDQKIEELLERIKAEQLDIRLAPRDY